MISQIINYALSLLTERNSIRKHAFLIGWVFRAFFSTHAQGQELTALSKQELQKLKQKTEDLWIKRSTALSGKASQFLYPSIEFKANQPMFLSRLSDLGFPVFLRNFNSKSANTIRTNRIQTGGSNGLKLNGLGIGMAEWDGGVPRRTHKELRNRIQNIDPSSSVTDFNDHATHVAGTMIGTGLNTLAKGMAFKGNLTCYDFQNDLPEMISRAATGDLLISNHSYGQICGWYGPYWFGDPYVNELKDYRFGFYGDQDQAIDQMLALNPYYLPVYAAGNDRNDVQPGDSTWFFDRLINRWRKTKVNRLPDGPFNCIPTGNLSKNSLCVGAIEGFSGEYANPASAVMSAFSNWGPTDDGRIKPDLVAAGVSVLSSVSLHDSAYGTKTGTSMASPSVAGSLALLQQHYRNQTGGKYLKSASLKALAIHTTDEAGPAPGPDYMYGWGLMNSERAASVITAQKNTSLILEDTLGNDSTFIMKIIASGTGPITATLCWTDLAGNPVAPSLDPTNRMLINDLDIKIFSNVGSAFLPYILNPASPGTPATTGDNSRDNVEKIFMANPSVGVYFLQIKHKGILQGGQQAFSLIVSGMMANSQAPTITSFSPQSGPIGTIATVQGSNFNNISKVTVGGSPVPFLNTSSTQIQVTVNSHALSGPIGIITNQGTAMSEQEFFITNGHPLFCGLEVEDGGFLSVTNSWKGDTAQAGTRTYWSFNAVANEQYSFFSCFSESNTALQIYNEEGIVLGFNDKNGPFCTQSEQASLLWTCPANGRYFVLLTDESCKPLASEGILRYRSGTPNYPPVIEEVTPWGGFLQTSVLISGTNITIPDSVVFNNAKAQFSTTGNVINTLVPALAKTGRIKVYVNGQLAVSRKNFQVWRGAPTICNDTVSVRGRITPSSFWQTVNAPSGTRNIWKISVNPNSFSPLVFSLCNNAGELSELHFYNKSGQNFPVQTASCESGFQGTYYFEYSNFVPTSDTIYVALTGPGCKVLSSVTSMRYGEGYSLFPPILLAVSPNKAKAGDQVRLSIRSGLNTSSSPLTGIELNNLAIPFSVESTVFNEFKILLQIPPTASTGRWKFKNANLTVLSDSFEIGYPPIFSGFTPAMGLPGTEVTISGSHFTYLNVVRFGDVSASFIVLPSGNIRAVVPAGASTGKLSVETCFGYAASTIDFQLPGSISALFPVIHGFSPASGAVGTELKIKGKNFIPSLTGNTVYFGAVKAQAVTASDTMVVVRVPKCASYGPIQITSHKRTASSTLPFCPTFPSAGLGTQPMRTAFNLQNVSYSIPLNAIQDMDNDGKPDILDSYVGVEGTKIQIFRNKHITGFLSSSSFDAPFAFHIDQGLPFYLKMVDFDGDGDKDILAGISEGADSLAKFTLYLNGSTPGSFSFTPVWKWYGGKIGQLEMADFDQDGREDLLFCEIDDLGDTQIRMMRNKTSNGNVGFEKPQTIVVVKKIDSFFLAYDRLSFVHDVNKDGKPDILISSAISIYLQNKYQSDWYMNSSQGPGNISFSRKAFLKNWPNTTMAASVDLNGDRRSELAFADFSSWPFSKLEILSPTTADTSNSDSAAFNRQSFDSYQLQPRTKFGVCDVDGNGKPDLLNEALIFENTSTQSSISMNQFFYGQSQQCSGKYNTSCNDLDGDGKPDFVVPSGFEVIFQNKIGSCSDANIPVITATNPIAVCEGSPVTLSVQNPNAGLSYQWSNGATGSSITATQTGSYSAVTVNANCLSQASNSISVQVIAKPVAGFTQTDGYLQASPAGLQYQWFLDGSPISGATSQLYPATIPGNYSVKVTRQNCADTSDTQLVTVLSVDEAQSHTLLVFPNPTSREVFVHFPDSPGEIRIFNSAGIEIFVPSQITPDSQSKVLDLKDHPDGYYFLQIREGTKGSMRKIWLKR